jgi:hypothetical protein
MTWWGLITVGLVWVATVVGTVVVSLQGAQNVVAADLAGDPNGLQYGTAIVSALIFAGPGLFFITLGVKQRMRRS